VPGHRTAPDVPAGLGGEAREAARSASASGDACPDLFEQLLATRTPREQRAAAARSHALAPPEAEDAEITPRAKATVLPPGTGTLSGILDDQGALCVGQ
jgi:hypothetical protein